MDADNLHRRLKKIIGQLGAIDKMVDQDVPCEDMLMPLQHHLSHLVQGALGGVDLHQHVLTGHVLIHHLVDGAKSALHKVGQVVLEGHLNHCVRDGIEHGDADRTIAEFAKAIEHFSRMS